MGRRGAGFLIIRQWQRNIERHSVGGIARADRTSVHAENQARSIQSSSKILHLRLRPPGRETVLEDSFEILVRDVRSLVLHGKQGAAPGGAEPNAYGCSRRALPVGIFDDET